MIDFKSSKNALKIKEKTVVVVPDVLGRGHTAPGPHSDMTITLVKGCLISMIFSNFTFGPYLRK